ncbi:hypothetical protein GW17_00044716 [Ensete ventricosum]|nr:hypothetical protein GW17_00044716 [Ensete ventricosum]
MQVVSPSPTMVGQRERTPLGSLHICRKETAPSPPPPAIIINPSAHPTNHHLTYKSMITRCSSFVKKHLLHLRIRSPICIFIQSFPSHPRKKKGHTIPPANLNHPNLLKMLWYALVMFFGRVLLGFQFQQSEQCSLG